MEDRKKRLTAFAVNVDRTTNHTKEDHRRRSGSDAMTSTATTDHVTDVFMDHNDDDYRTTTTTTNDSTTIPNKRKLLHFRNYIPSDPTFLHNDDHPTNDIHPPISTTKSVLQLALERARSELLLHSNTTTLKHYHPTTTVTTKPKNHTIHADLQRNIQSKLHRLEQQTQRALVSILRHRLEQEATTTTTTIYTDHST